MSNMRKTMNLLESIENDTLVEDSHTVEFTIPDIFLSAALNDDTAGLDEEEMLAWEQFLHDNTPNDGNLVAINSEPLGFCRSHDMLHYGVDSTNCSTVTFTSTADTLVDLEHDPLSGAENVDISGRGAFDSGYPFLESLLQKKSSSVVVKERIGYSDPFLEGYIDAVLTTESACADCTVSDELIDMAKQDCEMFKLENADLLAEYYSDGGSPSEAGHHFWMTRNSHSDGFSGPGGDIFYEELTSSAEQFGAVDTYVKGYEIFVV